ncbi:MAG: class IIb bacteriocin, lactobin A/cerein 7B family [Prolixibacteraceae bacterium]|nr:class IIb bacteriocin, lactobin A/cerein 7B family [Prolixibacteraceae bacterium]
MKELTKEELLNVNGGFWVWLGLTLLVACADSPDDFKQGLKDAAESD